MLIRPTAFTIGLIIYSFIALFFVYTEFGIDSRGKHLSPFVAPLLTTKGACQLLLTTKQPAQIAQTAFGHYIEYFCFLRCLLDRGRVREYQLLFR